MDGQPVSLARRAVVRTRRGSVWAGLSLVIAVMTFATSGPALSATQGPPSVPAVQRLRAAYDGPSSLIAALSSGDAKARALAQTDLDADGAPDLVVGYAWRGAGIIAVHRGNRPPTGNVTVSDGTHFCMDTVAAGQCTITFNTAGSKSLTATYAGDANFASSPSAAESHQVNRLAPALPPCTVAPFTDVATNHPFCPEIGWMKDNTISIGFDDGTYRPSNNVTRQAMSAFLARVAGATPASCTSAPFVDVATGHPFCKEIQWMKDNGISTGFNDSTYRPSDNVTRQAMSPFLYRVSFVN